MASPELQNINSLSPIRYILSNMQSVNVSMTFIAPSANMPLKCALYAFTVMVYFFCELRVHGHKFHPLPSTYSDK